MNSLLDIQADITKMFSSLYGIHNVYDNEKFDMRSSFNKNQNLNDNNRIYSSLYFNNDNNSNLYR